MGELRQTISTFIESLKYDRRIISFDEAAIKQSVVLKLLNLLGWDIFNTDEVTPEYQVRERKVDYALRINNRAKVFIEVKSIHEDLNDHQEQLLDYCFGEGVGLAVLTNGRSWWFYLPLHEGSWEQRKFYTIDILQQDASEAASRFVDFLSKENIDSDNAITSAKGIYQAQYREILIHETLPKAWNKIIEEADEILLELLSDITESLCGFKPDSERCERFLLRYKERLMVPTIPARPTPRATFTDRARSVTLYTGRSISSFTFIGQSYKVQTWRELLFQLCEILQEKHGSEFEKVLTLRGRKRPYFSRNKNEMFFPQKISNSDIYAETNLSANSIVKICYDMLALFGYSQDDLVINCQ